MRHGSTWFIVASFTSVLFGTLALAQSAFAIPVFPGAVGFGTQTLAGRGGTVYKVTNLNESGVGSLAACAKAPGPRVCVFEVSGVIRVSNVISIGEPFLTIAGQTAPSPGIMIRGGGLEIRTHDVLIQHMSVRPGDESAGPSAGNRDSIQIQGETQYNVVLDHVSISWSIDENIQIWSAGAHDITMSNSIISEGLLNSTHPEGRHSMGLIVGASVSPDPYNISIIGNLFAHNNGRSPLVRQATIVNNMMYNWGFEATTLNSNNVDPTFGSIVGNYYKQGVNSGLPAIRIGTQNPIVIGSKWYLSDNIIDGMASFSDPWDSQLVREPGFNIRATTPQQWPTGLTVRSGAA